MTVPKHMNAPYIVTEYDPWLKRKKKKTFELYTYDAHLSVLQKYKSPIITLSENQKQFWVVLLCRLDLFDKSVDDEVVPQYSMSASSTEITWPWA